MALPKSVVLMFFVSVAAGNLTTSAQTISFTPSPQSVTSPFPPAVVVDVDGDGWLDTLGTLNDGSGILLPLTADEMGVGDLFVPSRPNDVRVADLDEDGCPDLIAEGYSSTTTDTRALLYFNDCTGEFRQDPTFAGLNIRGRGEGLVVADFNNDGHIDIFLPYYTFQPCTDTLCPNSPQSYLFLGDGHGHFREVATAAGVDLSTAPGATPEGAQAADVDNNGLTDLYAGGHLFLNHSIDSSGTPHFQDCACGLPPAPIPKNPGWDDRADEGFKFLDWNNDGLLDLVIQNWGNGPPPPYGPPPPPGPTLYLNRGTSTQPSFVALSATTDGAGHPFFSTGAPDYQQLPFSSSYGVNAYDMDNDGLEDIIVAASGGGIPSYPNVFFRNTGHGYEQVLGPDVPSLSYGTMAFGDINQDGKIDLIYSWPLSHDPYYFINTSPAPPGSFLSIEMLGPNGERNQQGRVVQVQPQGASQVTYTLVVDGGSGYHSQNQYALLVGTPYAGPHKVTAIYPAAGGGTTAVFFNMNPGEYARVLAPPSLGLGTAFGSSSEAVIAAGASASYTLTIGGQGLGGSVSLVCTGAPTGTSCSLPDTLNIKATSASTFTVNVITTAGASALLSPVQSPMRWIWIVGIFGVALLPNLSQAKTGPRTGGTATFLTLLLLLSSAGCGSTDSASNKNRPAATYTLTVTAQMGSVSQSMPIVLTVE